MIKKFIPLSLAIAGIFLVSAYEPLNWNNPTWAQHGIEMLVVVGLLMMNYPLVNYQTSRHAQKIQKKNKSPYHGLAFLIRVVPIVGFSLLAHAHAFDWIEIILLSLVAASFWGVLFNPMLNKKRELPTFNIDKDGNGSLIDKFLWKHFKEKGGAVMFVLCVICLILFSVLYTLK